MKPLKAMASLFNTDIHIITKESPISLSAKELDQIEGTDAVREAKKERRKRKKREASAKNPHLILNLGCFGIQRKNNTKRTAEGENTDSSAAVENNEHNAQGPKLTR